MKTFWIILLIVIVVFLIGRYYIAGKGNKNLICPSTFGFGWDKDCVDKEGYIIKDNNTLIKK